MTVQFENERNKAVVDEYFSVPMKRLATPDETPETIVFINPMD